MIFLLPCINNHKNSTKNNSWKRNLYSEYVQKRPRKNEKNYLTNKKPEKCQ